MSLVGQTDYFARTTTCRPTSICAGLWLVERSVSHVHDLTLVDRLLLPTTFSTSTCSTCTRTAASGQFEVCFALGQAGDEFVEHFLVVVALLQPDQVEEEALTLEHLLKVHVQGGQPAGQLVLRVLHHRGDADAGCKMGVCYRSSGPWGSLEIINR